LVDKIEAFKHSSLRFVKESISSAASHMHVARTLELADNTLKELVDNNTNCVEGFKHFDSSSC